MTRQSYSAKGKEVKVNLIRIEFVGSTLTLRVQLRLLEMNSYIYYQYLN